ncbi:MAG: non-heme iron oxygenase ferredoxin subunit [Gammaproteobacteria bacterium]|nr:MAG: non-heme iron oxygenase ferredoxin subunit [Gammaproteobacteria bacterium]
MKAVLSMAALAEGEMVACQVDGVDVLICQVRGSYYAVSNRCSHAGQTLSGGKLNDWAISCPLHGAQFDVRTGKCLAAPATQPIKSFPVTLQGGKVFVAIGDEY